MNQTLGPLRARLFGKHDFLALPADERDCLLVERDEGFATKPLATMGNDSISKVAACIKNSKSGFCCRAVERDIGGCDQQPHCSSNIFMHDFVCGAQHPAKFAQGRNRYRDQFGFAIGP
jgi:hypothetical protein